MLFAGVKFCKQLMTTIEALNLIRDEVLKRRENVWNRQLDRSSEFARMVSSAEKNGRLDAYENIADFIDEVIDRET